MQEEEQEVVEEEVVEQVLQHGIAMLHSDKPVDAVEVGRLEVVDNFAAQVVDIEWVVLLDDIVEGDPSNVVGVGHNLPGLDSVLEMEIFLHLHDHDHGPDQNSDYVHDLENGRLHGPRREKYKEKRDDSPLEQT